MKIGQKLILGFFAVALWIGVVGYISLNASEKAFQKTIGEASASLAAETMDKIDRAIHSRIEECRAWSAGSQVREITKESNKEFERYVEEAINIIKELEATEAHKEHKKIHFKLLALDGKPIYSTRPFESSKSLFDKKALAARNGYFVGKENESIDGEKLIAYASSKGYKDYKGFGWILIVEHETSEILAPVAELKKTILIISLAVMTLAVLTGLSISHSILKPIRKVRDATLEIGKGNLDTKVEIKLNDEVGQLAGSFGRMAEALKRMIDKLNKEIVERTKAEKALEALNEELESTIQELTRSNKELKHFAHIVAHDLKTPLRAIGTLADWISMDYGDKLDEQGRKQVKLLKSRARRMNELVDRILQYCEIGRVMRAGEEVNLNTLIAETIVEIAPPENIAITIENELPVIKCERNLIIQVFQNLLSNAIKYMDKPQGRIRIACVEENGFWKFSVADNGPGIEEKYFEKIFQMFQTLSPRDEFESSGVGLTLVKKIVELYRGNIWVESEVGKGCTFLFTLPIRNNNVVKNDRLLLASSY